jgi:hypothetical protein
MPVPRGLVVAAALGILALSSAGRATTGRAPIPTRRLAAPGSTDDTPVSQVFLVEELPGGRRLVNDPTEGALHPPGSRARPASPDRGSDPRSLPDRTRLYAFPATPLRPTTPPADARGRPPVAGTLRVPPE